ncbi:TetR/AcrR family transcriptional regulator [Paenibacillus eucommiae]|uniref:AcrR family transcriptional regulator n=1 Tax=Paenibacillus eucommiae TaxID=1355755 RepID=A0ABS4IU32_9BACL|nr:TetR/AcrR family transcriptional regulator [Paenibacillus eucommiae]MBP1991080.1 AcrR family transcriptional regulator [Paenibacillus eucommiae]
MTQQNKASKESKELEKRFNEGFEEMVPDQGARQIILHATEVFAKKGLVGTKIKDIAAKAGFSQGYIYNYFKSKDDIFTKIVELAAEGAGNSVKYAAELQGTPYERIYWLTEAFLSPESIAMQHWRLIMLQATTSEAIPEEAKRISKELARKPFEYFIPMLIEGQQAGEIVQGDPMMLAITYFSFIQGLGITRMQNGKHIPFPPVEIVLRFLREEEGR